MTLTRRFRATFAAAIAAATLALLTAGAAAPAHADLTGPKAPPPPPSRTR